MPRAVTHGRSSAGAVRVITPHRVRGLVLELRDRRERLLRVHHRAAQVARRRERKEERVGLAVHQREADTLPALVGVVVDQRPSLERARVALRRDQESVSGPPDRRLGDVTEGDRSARVAEQRERAVVLRAAGGERVERAREAAREGRIDGAHLADLPAFPLLDLSLVGEQRDHSHHARRSGPRAGVLLRRRGGLFGLLGDLDEPRQDGPIRGGDLHLLALQADEQRVIGDRLVDVHGQAGAGSGDPLAHAGCKREPRDLTSCGVVEDHQRLERVVEVAGGYRERRRRRVRDRAGPLEVADAGLVEPQRAQREDRGGLRWRGVRAAGDRGQHEDEGEGMKAHGDR